jgi:arabinofuranosyltransferase
MREPLRFLYIPILAAFGVTTVLLFRFSAEDAFITYRYAENLATIGALVFNRGEPILALTSPLHGLLSTGLYVLTGHTVLANKLLGLVLLLATAAAVWVHYRDRPVLQPLVLTLILAPPCVVLWTFGGLETPILLFLVTSAALLAMSPQAPSRVRLCGVFVLAGLAFLTRFDSILFVAPLLLHMAIRARAVRDVGLAMLAGAALPTVWLIISWSYYGDIFPTSFYAKTPNSSLPVLIGNGKYVLFNLLMVGIIPALLLALAIMQRPAVMARTVFGHLRARWWLYAGIAAQLLYGLTMAQTHMMFSFRYFVPYIPAFAIISADLVGRALSGRGLTHTRRSSVLGLAVLTLVAFQGFQVHYTFDRSVNGLSPWGEYRATGVRDYVRFINTLRHEGENIREHWATVPNSSQRLPRIYTYAGGVVPHTFRESYIYETLVSYRHCPPEEGRVEAPNVWMTIQVDLRSSADYIHMLTPRHGPIPPQLPRPVERFDLISSYEVVFDGYPERFLVFHNPSPAPHTLTSTLHGRCGPVRSGFRSR